MGEPQGYDPREIIYRIGTYFLLIGFGMLAFFMLSEASRNADFSYFCWSMILFLMGFLFRSRYKKTVTPSGRFSILKRLQPKSKEEKKE